MKAIRKDFFMEIRKNKARFISIFFIVALGVAFFSGIQAASPDMRHSGDAYFDETQLMDMKVMSTMGLTDKDVEALTELKGVVYAEGAFSTDVVCGETESSKVLHIESLNKKVNQLTVSEGRLPEKSGELFLDRTYAQTHKYQLGDRIRFTQEEGSELLQVEEYTIVGIGTAPLYISFSRGNTTLGTGEISGFAYVMPEDFEQEVYTQIYLKARGAQDLVSYTDGYDNLIDKVTGQVEGIEEIQCQARYEEIRGEAEAELADAKKEYEEGKAEALAELADAEKELADGEKELADGKAEYDDGVQKLTDAKATVADGWAQLESAKQELSNGYAELESARAQAIDGQNQLDSAQAEVDAGWNEVNAQQEQLDAGRAQLAAGKEQLNAGLAQIEAARATLDQSQAELDAGIAAAAAGKEQIAAKRQELNAQREQCAAGLSEVEAQEAQIPSQEEALAAARTKADELTAQAQALRAELEALQNSETAAPEEIEAKTAETVQAEETAAASQAEVENQAAMLEETKAQLAAARSQLEGSIVQIDAGLAELNTQEQSILAQEAAFPQAQEQIDQGRAQLEQQAAELVPVQEELLASEEQLNAGQAQLDEAKNTLYAGQAEIDANAAEISAAWGQIAAGEQELADGEAQIAASEQELINGEAEIAENEQKLADAKKELANGETELANGKKEYADAKKEAETEFAEAETELADAQREIEELKKPEWIVSDRHDLPEYSDYGDNADRIRNIGQVFPVIFFLVAALVSLTTMTRMVEEQRTQIGTLKALGYGKYAIASKYLNYAFLATMGGSVLGVAIGQKILPYIIIKAYGLMYHNMASTLHIQYKWRFALIASVAAVICTIGATIFSCAKALAETPASLMRPPAPKEGKRILLERVGIVWRHLSFTWKSTLRNLFRYKKRLLMTIFGIAGSMALMLVGYGIKDSIMDIGVRQYEELQHYDAAIIGDEDATQQEQKALEEFLEGNEKLDHYTHVQLSSYSVPRERSSISAYVYVPEELENFSKDVTLQDRRTKEPFSLTDEGAAVSEKTASLTGLSVGDELTIVRDNKEYKVKIASITENYMAHYIYMTPKVYEKTFGEKPEYTTTVFTVKEEYKDEIQSIGNEILKYPAALSISYTSSIAEQIERMLNSLGMVIIVLIVSAGMLAFVVLYNLNNINITERQRELATLKVLGFYDKEVSAYVFRENVLLTLIGVLAGGIFGIFLHRYVIVTVEVDAVMFGRNIKAMSFLYSGLFTVGFAAVVNFFMHFKLKKIDMVESLKSVE